MTLYIQLLIFAAISINVSGQIKNINCDSLSNLYKKQELISIVIEKMPQPKISIDRIQTDFIALIDSSIIFKTIFLRITIDTLGNVICPEILKGNNNFIDTIAINYISKIKFTPAENKGEKIVVPVNIPLRGIKD